MKTVYLFLIAFILGSINLSGQYYIGQDKIDRLKYNESIRVDQNLKVLTMKFI